MSSNHHRFDRYLARHNNNGTPPPALQPETPEPKYTLSDAFNYFNTPDSEDPTVASLNDQRCIRAVAFLLHYCSEHGNESVHGFSAHGLAHVLEKCAGKLALAEKHREWLRSERKES